MPVTSSWSPGGRRPCSRWPGWYLVPKTVRPAERPDAIAVSSLSELVPPGGQLGTSGVSEQPRRTNGPATLARRCPTAGSTATATTNGAYRARWDFYERTGGTATRRVRSTTRLWSWTASATDGPAAARPSPARQQRQADGGLHGDRAVPLEKLMRWLKPGAKPAPPPRARGRERTVPRRHTRTMFARREGRRRSGSPSHLWERPPRHMHWFRWAGDDPVAAAGRYSCRCGQVRPGL